MSESHESVWADRGRPPEDRRSPKASRRTLKIWTAVTVVLVAAVAFGLVPALREDADREAAREAAAQARLEAAERERLIRQGRPVRAKGPASAPRAELVAAGEAAITRDARQRRRTGEITSPVNGTSCRPFPFTDTRAAQEADADIDRNRYQCIAYSSRFELPELEGKARTGVIGQPYWLIAEYATGALVFCKVTPRPGEGGKALVEVPVDPACRDPLRS